MDCEKDKIGKFERGCSQNNHRKVTGFGLSQDSKKPIMTFGSRVRYAVNCKNRIVCIPRLDNSATGDIFRKNDSGSIAERNTGFTKNLKGLNFGMNILPGVKK